MNADDTKWLEEIKQRPMWDKGDMAWLIARLEAEAQENERLQQELHGRRLTEMDRLENLGNRAEAAEADRDAIREEWTRVFATLRKEREAAEATCKSLLEQSSRWEAQALEAAVENERLREQAAIHYKIRSYVAFALAGDEMADVQLAADRMVARAEAAKARYAELEALFALQQIRMAEATYMWQEATGRRDVLLDLGDLLAWLMARPAALEAQRLEAGAQVRELEAKCREYETSCSTFARAYGEGPISNTSEPQDEKAELFNALAVVTLLKLARGRMQHIVETAAAAMTHAEVRMTQDVIAHIDAAFAPAFAPEKPQAGGKEER